MKVIQSLVIRNLKLFFRSKSEVFFSFLSVIIILGLYALFLSDLQVLNLKQALQTDAELKPLVNSWIMSGLIAVSTVTLSLGTLGRMVSDSQKHTIDEFLVAPIKRTQILLSYVISAILISFIISMTLFVIAELYILSSGGTLLSIIQILKVIGIIILSVISSSLFMLLFVSFFKNEQAYGTFCTIVGTLIGFVTGAYIPMGIMPKFIQTFSNILPVSQTASLLRKIFLEHPSSIVFANNTKYLKEYYYTQGVDLYFGNTELSFNFMIIYILIAIVVFLILNILRFRYLKNK